MRGENKNERKKQTKGMQMIFQIGKWYFSFQVAL